MRYHSYVCNNEPQFGSTGDGASETSTNKNYELQSTGWATRAPVA